MNTTLCKNIDWVGYVDWSVRDFHSYVTSRGATYNSYLIRDNKTALIDTVKANFVDHLLSNISALTSLDAVDFIVVNHAEPDHSGGLSEVVSACKNATVVCDAKCRDTLSSYHDTTGWSFQIVATGDTISLGERTLSFLETPMVHWPESMFTYIPEEKLLFSMDAFGQHFASNNRFDDEVDITEVMEEAKKYYANIVMLFGSSIKKVLKQAAELDIDIIAPAHGVIWRKYIPNIIDAYKEWVVCKAKPKVLVIYDTMWQSTHRMAEAIVDGANTVDGVEVKLIYIRSTDLTSIATDMLDAAAIAVGTPTLNMGMMPMMSAVLTYLKGLKPIGKCGFAFGSYGWSKGGADDIFSYLKDMKVDIVLDTIRSKWRPDDAVLSQCRDAGVMLAKRAQQS